MTQENGEVMVRDLGSTNGIRINGQRVEIGRIRPGDELSIAHIRYRLENGQGHEQTIAEAGGRGIVARSADEERVASVVGPTGWMRSRSGIGGENAFAAAVRKLLPNGVADKCRIQVIVQMAGDPGSDDQEPVPVGPNHASENAAECHSDSVPLISGNRSLDRPAAAGPLDRPASGV